MCWMQYGCLCNIHIARVKCNVAVPVAFQLTQMKSQAGPGQGRKCTWALPLWPTLHACSLGFARLQTNRQIEMQHIFYIALQYAYYTCNAHIAQIYVLHLPYDYGQHINVLKHSIYVKYGCGKKFEVAVSLNHDVMTSFWLHRHKLPSTAKSELSKVCITVSGCCCMPIDSISMCSNILCMSNADEGSSLRWLLPQQWHYAIILTPQVTQNPKIWPK